MRLVLSSCFRKISRKPFGVRISRPMRSRWTAQSGHAVFEPLTPASLFCKFARPQTAQSLLNVYPVLLRLGRSHRRCGEARYNPLSYHNGSIWPHDNALIGRGLSLYGFRMPLAPSSTVCTKPACMSICIACPNFSAASTSALIPSALLFTRSLARHRLGPPAPRIFCFKPSRPHREGAGAPNSLRQSYFAAQHRGSPHRQFGLSGGECDVIIHRYYAGVSVDVLRKKGEIEVLKSL